MNHLSAIRGAEPLVSPAGTIFITDYSIWHRRSAKTKEGVRNMLKYFYWRTQPPARDWIAEPDFDFSAVDYSSPMSRFTEQFRDHGKVAEKFLWLCGEHGAFQNLGGQSWPLPAHRNDIPYGYPEDLPVIAGRPSPHALRVADKKT